MKKSSIIIVVAILLVIVVGVVATIFVMPSMKVNNIHKKLSQINAKELETKIIQKLETSPINVNTTDISTKICSMEDMEKSGKVEELAVTAIDINYQLNKMPNPYKEYISAYITSTDSNKTGRVFIPCFKISSDSKGNFQSIEYMNTSELYFIEPIIEQTIKEVLEKEYNIDISVIKSNSKNEKVRYIPTNTKIEMYITDTSTDTNIDKLAFGAKVFKTISNNMNGKYGAYSFNENDYYNIGNSKYSSVGFFFTTKTLKID